MTDQCVLAIRFQEFHKLKPLGIGEACANADMLQRAGIVEKPEQQRANESAITFLVPPKPGNNAIAVALMFDLEHHPLVRLVRSRYRLGNNAVETCALKSAKPIRGDAAIASRRCHVDGRRNS